MLRELLVFATLLALCIGAPKKIHPALDFYERGERGSLAGAPFSPLHVRSHAEWYIGVPMNSYPCTEEPYYVRTLIQNSRVNQDPVILPYNSPFEGHYGNFFTIFDQTNTTSLATYVGPVSTHVFPPPRNIFEQCLIEFPRAIAGNNPRATNEPQKQYHFELDIAKAYEFPYTSSFRYNLDQPLYLYNRADNTWKLHRLWGTSGVTFPKYASDCVGAPFKVKEIRETTEIESCTPTEAEGLEQAISSAREMAQFTADRLEHITSNRQQSEELMQWFGKEAIKRENLEQLQSSFQKMIHFIPSWFVCEEATEQWLQGSEIPNKQELRFRFQRYHDYEGLLDGGIEDEAPELTEDRSGIADIRLYCTPGMTTWITPRDQSRTIHVCPLFFTLNPTQRAATLIDTMVRFEEIAGAIDLVFGQNDARSLASTQPTSVCLQNASSYSHYADLVSREDDTIIYAN